MNTRVDPITCDVKEEVKDDNIRFQLTAQGQAQTRSTTNPKSDVVVKIEDDADEIAGDYGRAVHNDDEKQGISAESLMNNRWADEITKVKEEEEPYSSEAPCAPGRPKYVVRNITSVRPGQQVGNGMRITTSKVLSTRMVQRPPTCGPGPAHANQASLGKNSLPLNLEMAPAELKIEPEDQETSADQHARLSFGGQAESSQVKQEVDEGDGIVLHTTFPDYDQKQETQQSFGLMDSEDRLPHLENNTAHTVIRPAQKYIVGRADHMLRNPTTDRWTNVSFDRVVMPRPNFLHKMTEGVNRSAPQIKIPALRMKYKHVPTSSISHIVNSGKPETSLTSQKKYRVVEGSRIVKRPIVIIQKPAIRAETPPPQLKLEEDEAMDDEAPVLEAFPKCKSEEPEEESPSIQPETLINQSFDEVREKLQYRIRNPTDDADEDTTTEKRTNKIRLCPLRQVVYYALLNSPEGRMTTLEVYNYICETFPHSFSKDERGLRDQICRILSATECFKRYLSPEAKQERIKHKESWEKRTNGLPWMIDHNKKQIVLKQFKIDWIINREKHAAKMTNSRSSSHFVARTRAQKLH